MSDELPATDRLSVDVISDVMCPWCFIGKRRLEKAASQSEIPLDIRWRPYQLDPTLPPEGKDRSLYLAEKFGSAERARSLYVDVRAAGAQEAIPFDFDAIEVSPNTLDAHRLIRWSASAGVQDAIVEALFNAYFIEGRRLNEPETLTEIAAKAGMDPDVIAELLASGADRDLVEEEIALARQMGVSGVPTFIVGNRYVVVGAQAPDVLVEAFNAALAASHNANDNGPA
ncbi:DsbA family oxidoreductase [Afifella marina]|uniref:Predicted dithiol-disulfide isomerase, DsbA family n=1 Tax=Afifella marina DSM 2698 TaxID=1120955 RepID=A0A1G5NGP5_AFIMA|nr:DsbA family oxidoreductase [Afifella marina]MBK1623464.1 DsbA family oxidoreductase [Afifella marina DSM 2698]MBK1626457.1 DsbA family oxidoreductase [Afifella marina]MBK5916006.1 disulfide bond formation protein DsbA [Afifella marina]RAI18383.1 disulfide bond formation protein DsbA [Afifella marina DSM 2698]SCZ36575.1 Predicted dithiol-disulfide isomerase, DsbA family [Afifella marina DSM 2698]